MFQLLGLESDKAYDSEIFKLGTIAFDGDSKGYMFAQAAGTLNVGDVATITHLYQAAPLTGIRTEPGVGQGLPCGVANGALANDQYGWLQIYGPVASVNAGPGCLPFTNVSSTGVDGRVNDGDVAGTEKILGLVLTSAESGGYAPAILNYPIVGTTY